MSFLFGSAPSVKTSTNPTINPIQEGILGQLASYLQSGAPAPGSAPYGGSFAAPLQSIQNMSLAALEQQSMNLASPQQFDPTQAFNSLSKVLSGGANVGQQNVAATGVDAPLISGAPNVSAGSVGPQQIDATDAFRRGVVEPMTTDFLGRTLPAIAGKYGAGAGGAFSSDHLQARTDAATDLERTLSQTGSQFAYDAAKANQTAALQSGEFNVQAALQAALANQGKQQQGELANQASLLSARTANAGNTLTADLSNQASGQRADTTNLSAILSALGITPSVSGIPNTTSAGNINNLIATLGAGSVPYNVAQTQVSGQYGDYLQQQQFTQQRLADAIASFSPSTIQTTSTAQGGSSGLLGGLIGGVGQYAGSAGGSAGITALLSALSDRRAKEDYTQVGEVDGFPLYKFKYKADPSKVVHIGLMAQDVEKRKPAAVTTGADGLKRVNYAKALEDIFAEAA